MQLRHLTTFAAVAETLSFTKAAARLHLAQSSVTEQIQSLEAEFGTALFHRRHRELALTEAGHQLAAFAPGILGLAEKARAAVANVVVDDAPIVIAAHEALAATRISALITAFTTAHPHARIDLRGADSLVLPDDLLNGDVDIAFLFGEVAKRRQLISQVIAQEPLLVVAPAGYHRWGAQGLSLRQLRDAPFVITPEGTPYRDMFDLAFPAGEARPRVLHEVATLPDLFTAVVQGEGCALVPRVSLRHISDAIVQLPWHGLTTPVTMVWRRRRAHTPAVKAFLAEARITYGSRR